MSLVCISSSPKGQAYKDHQTLPPNIKVHREISLLAGRCCQFIQQAHNVGYACEQTMSIQTVHACGYAEFFQLLDAKIRNSLGDSCPPFQLAIIDSGHAGKFRLVVRVGF